MVEFHVGATLQSYNTHTILVHYQYCIYYSIYIYINIAVLPTLLPLILLGYTGTPAHIHLNTNNIIIDTLSPPEIGYLSINVHDQACRVTHLVWAWPVFIPLNHLYVGGPMFVDRSFNVCNLSLL